MEFKFTEIARDKSLLSGLLKLSQLLTGDKIIRAGNSKFPYRTKSNQKRYFLKIKGTF